MLAACALQSCKGLEELQSASHAKAATLSAFPAIDGGISIRRGESRRLVAQARDEDGGPTNGVTVVFLRGAAPVTFDEEPDASALGVAVITGDATAYALRADGIATVTVRAKEDAPTGALQVLAVAARAGDEDASGSGAIVAFDLIIEDAPADAGTNSDASSTDASVDATNDGGT